MAGLFQPKIEGSTVKVVSVGDGAKYTVSWPTVAGAAGYFVYAGFDPLHIRSRVSGQDPLPESATSFNFTLPFSPPGRVVYFWVSSTDGITETFLDDTGSYHIGTAQLGLADPSRLSQETSDRYFVPDDQKFYFEEIRRRAKAILEDTSEDVDLFIKQWRGLPEPATQAAYGLDPNYQGMTRDPDSFGTGFYPGFFPAIRLRMRFGALPNSLLDFQLPGLRPLLTNEAWTLWDPIVHENDLIVRVATGVRYVVNSNAFSNYRGIPITQRLSLDVVSPTSPLMTITDLLVRARWQNVNAADFARLGFSVVDGGQDFLLFE